MPSISIVAIPYLVIGAVGAQVRDASNANRVGGDGKMSDPPAAGPGDQDAAYVREDLTRGGT
jgi:hypothetical protein